MPGKLERAGRTPSGSTNSAVRPASRGAIVIVTSVPAVTGFIENSVTDAGAGPGDGPVVRNTNGCGKRPKGTLAAGASVARYQPVGAPVSRSMPGSCEAT